MKVCPECGNEVKVRTWKYCSADCVKAVDVRRAKTRIANKIAIDKEREEAEKVFDEKQRLKRERRRGYKRAALKKDLIGELLKRAKRRAVEKGLEFSIDRCDIEVPIECPVFHVPFIPGDRCWTHSLDRIDSTKGYVPGNVRVISARANRIKTNGNVSEMQAIVAYMLRERFSLSICSDHSDLAVNNAT